MEVKFEIIYDPITGKYTVEYLQDLDGVVINKKFDIWFKQEEAAKDFCREFAKGVVISKTKVPQRSSFSVIMGTYLPDEVKEPVSEEIIK